MSENKKEIKEKEEIKVVDEVIIEESVVEKNIEKVSESKEKKSKKSSNKKEIVNLTHDLVTYSDGSTEKITTRKQHSDLRNKR